MNKVNYNSELFDLLKDLTPINTQIVLQKDEDGKVLVRRADSESTIAYQLKAPKEYFDFENDQIAFYNYPEFYQYFKAIIEPDIFIDDKIIILKNNDAISKYLLTKPESIPAGPKSINFNNPDIRINFQSADLDEFLKMINLINSKKAQIFGNGDKVTIKIYNNNHDNTFEKSFKVENLSNFSEDIDFVIFSDTFKNLPAKRNYVIDIKSQGFIKISLVDENLNLDIYTGKVKN